MKTVFSIAKPFRRSVLLAIGIFALVGFIGAGSVNAQRAVRAVGATAQAGQQVFVSIDLDAIGDEVAGSFSVTFDQTKLSISGISSPGTNPDVTLGTGVPAGTAITVNAQQVALGRIGFLVDSNNQFAAGPNRQIVRLRFTIAAGAAAGPTTISFGNTPTPRSFSNNLGEPLTATFTDGTVTIQAAAPPVTVSGRVTVTGGAGLRNAIVTMTAAGGFNRVATTSSFGYFTFTNVPSGGNYTVTVTSRRYTYLPRTQTISTNLTDFDFAAQ